MSQINNFFSSKFDDSTMTKLFIFEKYVESWMPVFLKQQVDYIYIFDFFAGAGYDSEGNSGSPIRVLEQIEHYLQDISKTKINLFFNEQKYLKNLKSNCDDYRKRNPSLDKIVNIEYSSEEFENIFNKIKNKIGKYPSLVFMDQFGVKYSQYIFEFEKFKKTDFLLFVSSSYLKRFAETPEFKNALNLSDKEIKKLKHTPYKLIHEATVQFLKERLSPNSPLKLYSFSLKKGSNIYGLIFGSKHPLAVDKFLHIVWKISSENGSANYDIYNDEEKKQPNLFPELVGKTSVQLFQESFKDEILSGRIKTNIDAYYYTLEKGHIPQHAVEVLRNLKKEGIINYNSKSPLINYESIIKRRRIVEYEKNKN